MSFAITPTPVVTTTPATRDDVMERLCLGRFSYLDGKWGLAAEMRLYPRGCRLWVAGAVPKCVQPS